MAERVIAKAGGTWEDLRGEERKGAEAEPPPARGGIGRGQDERYGGNTGILAAQEWQ